MASVGLGPHYQCCERSASRSIVTSGRALTKDLPDGATFMPKPWMTLDLPISKNSKAAEAASRAVAGRSRANSNKPRWIKKKKVARDRPETGRAGQKVAREGPRGLIVAGHQSAERVTVPHRHDLDAEAALWPAT